MLVTLLALSLAAVEPAPPPTLTVGALRLLPLAQLRVRGEITPDRSLSGETSAAITHRARVGAKATLDAFDLVVRAQDVRAWGSELVPDGLPPDPTVYGNAADGVSLHEAFVALHVGAVEARVGRQEIVIGNERLIGNLDWVQRGRAFDAVRVLHDGDESSWSVFGALIATAPTTERVLGGVHLEMELAPWSKLSPLIVYDGRIGEERHTTTGGARVDGNAGGFGYDVEAYGQAARTPAGGVTFATLVAARASYGFDTVLHPRVGLLTDAVSGASAPGKGGLGPFDTVFATNHKFYGFEDMFTVLPLHTQGRGLVDSAAALWVREGPWSAASFLHVFMPFGYAGPDVPVYGVEPDIVGSYKVTDNLSFDLGCALFVPTGTALGRGSSPAAWAYAQINAQL